MANKLYVRGASGNVNIPDLGITIAQGPSWTQLNYASPQDAEGDSGQFTSRELRDSGDLFDLVAASTLEWSKDGAVVEASGDYVADYMITEDFTDDTFNLENGSLVLPYGTSVPASGIEGQTFWDSDDDQLFIHDGSNWIVVATSSGVNTDHGALTGLLDDDHIQYLTEARHDLLPADNPHSVTFTQAVAADGGTDISAAEAETLTNGSNADALHTHDHGALTGTGDDDHAQYLLLNGDGTRNTVSGVVNVAPGELVLPIAVDVPGTYVSAVEGQIAWDSDDDILYAHNGTQWVGIAPASGIVTDHGALDGLTDDDHTQYTAWAQDETVTGVWTFNPADTEPNLILDPRASAPTNNLVDGAIAVVGGIVYVYDATRSKWLSLDRVMFNGGRKGNGTNIYLRLSDGIATSVTGFRMLRNGTITGLTAQSESSASWVFEVRKGGVVQTSLTISAATGNQDATIDVDFSAGDELQLYCNGVSIPSPVGMVEVAWRI